MWILVLLRDKRSRERKRGGRDMPLYVEEREVRERKQKSRTEPERAI